MPAFGGEFVQQSGVKKGEPADKGLIDLFTARQRNPAPLAPDDSLSVKRLPSPSAEVQNSKLPDPGIEVQPQLLHLP